MPATGSSHRVRLRTACDPCSRSKVRCDKKHPACDRCMQLKTTCSYSESRKHGRQSWRKRHSYERIRNAGDIETESQSLMTASQSALIAPLPEQTGWSALLPSEPAPLVGSQALESLLNAGQHGSSDDSTLFPSWSSGGGFSTEIDICSFGNWDTVYPLQSELPRRTNIPTKTLIHGNSSLPTTSAEVTSFTSSTNISTHSCEAQAISILGSMQHGEMYQGWTSCSNNPTHPYANLDLTPNFDRVLSINKAALSGWSKLMKCTCALCPHLTLLYVSILSKMLFWYRIAAKEYLPRPADTGSDDTTSNSDSNTRRLSLQDAPAVDRFGIRPTVIKVGMLNLDAEEQADMRRVLLHRELRRAEKAIDEFINVDRATILEEADDIVRRALQWSLTGISRVREELQDVIRQIRQTQ